MSCINNPKKFLGIKYNGDCVDEPEYVSKFMDTSSNFMVYYKCKFCGAKSKRHFVTHSELLHYGLTNEQIDKITSWSMIRINPVK